MRQKPGTKRSHGEKVVKDIRRATRKQYSAEEQTRIVLDGPTSLPDRHAPVDAHPGDNLAQTARLQSFYKGEECDEFETIDMDMAKRELPKHIYRQRNGIYFQRRGWPSQKFQSEFGTPEFWREYAGILSQKDKPRRIVACNFGALIDDYRKSPKYRNLKPRTGLDYDKHLDFFREIMGEANPAKMQRKDVIRLRDANAEKAYFANYSLRVLRVLMEHCVDLGWRESNPARGVFGLKTVKKEREPWPCQLLEAYRTACELGARERLVMELCVGTGQRIGDVLEMRWSDIQDGGFVVRQNKTGKELWVPVLPELQAALDAASRHSVFILTNERGTNRWSYRGA